MRMSKYARVNVKSNVYMLYIHPLLPISTVNFCVLHLNKEYEMYLIAEIFSSFFGIAQPNRVNPTFMAV